MYDPKKDGFGYSLKIKNRSFPKEGQFYTVENADNLLKISQWAYGYNRVSEIVNANSVLQSRINTGEIHRTLGGIPIVHKGDIIMIPQLTSNDAGDIEDIHPEFPDEVTIRVNGKLIHGFSTNSIERGINSLADTFSFTAPYDPSTEESRLLDAKTHHNAELFIDKKINMVATLEHWSFSLGEDNSTVTIGARSKPGVLIDCPSENARLDFSGQKFSQIADVLIKPFGLALEMPYGDTGIINQAKRELTQKVFDFLAGIAKSKGFILDSSKQGKIILDRANINGKPILNIIQGDPNVLDIKVESDGTKCFSTYKALSQTKGNPKTSSKPVRDESMSAYRPMIFGSGNNEKGDIGDAALWQRARNLAESFKVSVDISGWRDKENKIILENNIVTIYAPNACIHQETKMLIEKVSLKQNGKMASLSLVLPQAYTLEFPKVEDMPWVR
jgi:prophage tail gpP-like protein